MDCNPLSRQAKGPICAILVFHVFMFLGRDGHETKNKEERMRKLLAVLVLLSALVAACNPSPTPCPECTATAVALVTREARVSATETALAASEARGSTVEPPSPTPTDTPILPTPTPTRTPTPTLPSEPCGPRAVPPEQAGDYIGQTVYGGKPQIVLESRSDVSVCR